MLPARAGLVWEVDSSRNTIVTGVRGPNIVGFCGVALCCVVFVLYCVV